MSSIANPSTQPNSEPATPSSTPAATIDLLEQFRQARAEVDRPTRRAERARRLKREGDRALN